MAFVTSHGLPGRRVSWAPCVETSWKSTISTTVRYSGFAVRVRGAGGRRAWVSAQQENSSTPSPKEEHDIPDGGRDWNAEWSKFKEGGMKLSVSSTPLSEEVSEASEKPKQHSSRYKRDRERMSKLEEAAATRTVRPGTMRQQKAKQGGFAGLPPWSALQKDWRFWLGLIVSLSVLTSVLNTLGSAPAQVSTGYL